MALEGYPTSVTIKDINDSGNISRYTDGLFLELKEKNGRQKLSVKREDGNKVENIAGFYLDASTYLEESSITGQVECFRHDETNEIITITDKNKSCGRLFDKMRKYLKGNSRSNSVSSPESSRPASFDRSPPLKKAQPKRPEDKNANEQVNRLVDALNESNVVDAAKYARQLAQNNQSVQFALDMKNESGNVEALQKKLEPVVEPFKLKMSIETFLIDSADNQQYDVAIMPNTTIKDLKQIIQNTAHVSVNQQFWYIDRELLGDDYKFGKTAPHIRDNTVITLYLSAPINA